MSEVHNIESKKEVAATNKTILLNVLRGESDGWRIQGFQRIKQAFEALKTKRGTWRKRELQLFRANQGIMYAVFKSHSAGFDENSVHGFARTPEDAVKLSLACDDEVVDVLYMNVHNNLFDYGIVPIKLEYDAAGWLLEESITQAIARVNMLGRY